MQGAREDVIDYYAANPGQALIALELSNPGAFAPAFLLPSARESPTSEAAVVVLRGGAQHVW